MNVRKSGSNASASARRRLSGDNIEEKDVPRDITCEAVNDLRVVFAAYQLEGTSSILLRHLVEIMQMMGSNAGNIPTSTKIAEMAGVDIAGHENPWEAKLGFKDFLRFFAVFNISNKTVEVKAKDIFRAMDCDDSGEITAEELGKLLTTT